MEKKLKFIYLNIKSLKNNLDQLEAPLNDDFYKNTDVIVLTETKIYCNETDYINIPDYHGIFK